MTDTTTEAPQKIHWATQRRLDREAAIAAGQEPPPWPQTVSKRTVKKARIETKIEEHKKQLAEEDVFEGLTSKTCCKACTPEHCVITGRQFVRFEDQNYDHKGEPVITYTTGYTTYCGHPYKSGLQAKHKMMPDVLNRFAKAAAYLGHLAIDKGTG